MQIETGPFSGSPPAYPVHNQGMSNNYPPPQYPQRRLPPQVPPNTQGPPRMPMGQAGATSLSRIPYTIQQTKLQQLAEKERLLQQQKVQQIVVPNNATTSGTLNLTTF